MALRDAGDPAAVPAGGSPGFPIQRERTPCDDGRSTGLGERFLSAAEIAKRVGASQKWVRRKIADGGLPAHRIGRLLRVAEGDLAVYLARARLGQIESKNCPPRTMIYFADQPIVRVGIQVHEQF